MVNFRLQILIKKRTVCSLEAHAKTNKNRDREAAANKLQNQMVSSTILVVNKLMIKVKL